MKINICWSDEKQPIALTFSKRISLLHLSSLYDSGKEGVRVIRNTLTIRASTQEVSNLGIRFHNKADYFLFISSLLNKW